MISLDVIIVDINVWQKQYDVPKIYYNCKKCIAGFLVKYKYIRYINNSWHDNIRADFQKHFTILQYIVLCDVRCIQKWY